MPWQPCTAGFTSVLPYMVMILHAFPDVSIIIMYKNMPHLRKSEFDLTHDGSSQFWFDLIQAQDMTHLSALPCLGLYPLSARGSKRRE